ncbi:DNA polymerase III subunit alpha [Mycoplasmopsis bovirhinis]|uniref:PolC-type DNA polymerase III n=1 Tax=Mycoplasmopsis bovirhinis TaxID=29553 RepID=UPI000BB9C4C3|nr:PolC-type DNA polymerase III [Mycoplasmopsis bovirhinis]BBA22264.1 DNA polymerase III subunit alpha [Mycoplasmopsis bovirhinis]
MNYSNKAFDKLAKGIKLPFLSTLQDVSIINDWRDNGLISGTILLKKAPDARQFLQFIYQIEQSKNLFSKLSYEVQNYYQEQEIFKDYIYYFLSAFNSFKKIIPLINKNNDIYYSSEKKKWILKYADFELEKDFNFAANFLNINLARFGFNKVVVEAILDQINTTQIPNDQNFINEQYDLLKKREISIDKFQKNAKKQFSNNFNRTYRLIELDKLKDYSDFENLPICFFGTIYKNELFERENIKIHRYKITNEKDAISLVHFVNQETDQELIKLGSYVKVQGLFNPKNNNNKHQKTKNVRVDKIELVDIPVDQVIKDLSQEKRIEFNAKSKMNAMDGILDAGQIVTIAKDFGHKSVAILDSTSCQAYPKFAQAAKKAGIKPIYGVSFDVLEQSNKIFLTDFQNKNILDETYVVFDIETTSLSSKLGEIIEFGASIIHKGIITEEIQFFIKATKPLSKFTASFTNITDQMLAKDGLEISEALDKIYNILNNKTAIAHNANFDMNFIVQKFIDHNKPLPNTVYIDSLMISRCVSPYSKKHKLGDFANAMGVNYNSDVAHRADYDAFVLANAMLKAFDFLKNKQVFDFESLSKYLPNGNDYFKRINTSNSQISVIAKNQAGLKELFKLVSLASTERHFNGPKLFWNDLPKSENLLYGSGGLKSPLIDALLYSSDLEINQLIKRFDYIELPHSEAFWHKTSTGDYTKEDIEFLLKDLIKKAKEKNKTIIAIGDVRFEKASDQAFYKSLVYSKGIGGVDHFLFSYKDPNKLVIPNLSFLTTQEMKEKFVFLQDSNLIDEIVVKNTNYLDNMIDNNIQVIKDKLYTPTFDNSKEKLPELVFKTAKEKYGETLPEVILQRINKELDPIIKYGFHVIYWISHILVKKSNEDGYLVGSRGSVGSSLVATLSGITEINPLEPHYICSKCKYFEMVVNPPTSSGFDLDDKSCPKCGEMLNKDGHSIPFETFLGFNADKVPDIDLNFSGDYQPIIHAEVRNLFGKNSTFRAGTISSIQEKTAYGYVVAAVEKYHWKYTSDYIDYVSSKIIDVKRTTGQHPGGIIIIPKELDVEDFTPINFPANDEDSDWKTTHFDFHAIHDNVLKLDLLGHVDPTAIRMLERLTGLDVKKDIPSKDPRVISLFTSPKELNIKPSDIGGETTGAHGIPEFGTDFVRRMLTSAKPQSFADLIAISGLSHGTDVWTGNAEDLIIKEKMTLSDVISCRDDIMYFLIKHGVSNLDSFNIMENVRKGKGLSTKDEELLRSKNVPEWSIKSMNLIKYMFPRAHATAYVLMAWRIAWFKLYKPLEYYATFFTTRLSEFDIEILIEKNKVLAKLEELKDKKDKSVNEKALYSTLEIAREMYARGFGFLNIDLNLSLESEWVIDYNQNSLIAPFSAIKGLGDSVASKIVQARNQMAFQTKEDFKKRSGVNATLFGEMERLGVLEGLSERDQMSLF